jgi:hypothetical protein
MKEGTMLDYGSQFVYGIGAGANSFVPVSLVVTSKITINVYQEGSEGGGDGRQQQIL